jgi:trigger factor
MQITKSQLNDTKVKLSITADVQILQKAKKEALQQLAESTRLAGFRPGKAPLSLVEKQADPKTLQSEFLDRALNYIYAAAVEDQKLRPVAQPQVSIKKFVPYDTLEIEAEVEVVGDIKLTDYKSFKLPKPVASVTAKDVSEVIDNLRVRAADKKDVDREAKDGDQVWIDFDGVDTKTKEPVKGGDGKNYPLVLGSNTFIPGFEPNLIGLKSGQEKSFDIKFPKDYGVAALQNRGVTFKVVVSKVQEVIEPKLDDEFAAKVGPFKNMAELKADIKKQLTVEKESQSDRAYTDEVLTKVTEKSKVAIPDVLIDEQIDRLITDRKQDLTYRGQTWKEFLESEGQTEEEYRSKIKPEAELRVKAGIVLGEIADKEKITVTPEELEIRMQILKGQYKDQSMLAELELPQSRREIASRMISEKAIEKLKSFALSK